MGYRRSRTLHALALAAAITAALAAPAFAAQRPQLVPRAASFSLSQARIVGSVVIANRSARPAPATSAALLWRRSRGRPTLLERFAVPRLRAHRSWAFAVALDLPPRSTLGRYAVSLCTDLRGRSLKGASCRRVGTIDVTAAGEVLVPAATVAPAISGTAEYGQTLRTDNGAWRAQGPLSYRYQWERCTSTVASCTAVAGATAPSYTLGAADVGDTLIAVVSATNAAGTTSAASSASSVVAAADPAPYSSCNPAPLPAPAGPKAANTLIIDGEMTAPGQESNYASLANANTAVTFRSSPVAGQIGYPGSFAYAPPAANTQVQYWQQNGYSFYYTAVSSDFAVNNLPLFIAECDGDAALRMSDDAGLYIHELVTQAAAADGWNWTAGVDSITTAEWQTINYWVSLAKLLNKQVIWSEPALGWQALLANATAQGYLAQWGSALVPMFATNFDSESSGYFSALARASAEQAASSYGTSLGESIQSWWFRGQTDLAAQEAAGLPTSGAGGPPASDCSAGQGDSADHGYELDPLNTDSYAYVVDSVVGCYGDPLNQTLMQNEPSLTPSASSTLALANFGDVVGASYYEVEGTDGPYQVAAGAAGAYPDVDDMSWPTPGDPSPFMQGIQQFSAQLAAGTPAPAQPATVAVYQLWDGAIVSHYETTSVNSDGVPLDPNGDVTQNCNDSDVTTDYCYQNTPEGAAPVPAGYVSSTQVAGSVALEEYQNGAGAFYYTTGGSGPPGFTLVGSLGYVMPSEVPGTEPLYVLYEPVYNGHKDYFYTTDAGQRATALASFFDYQDQGVAGYLFTYAPAASLHS